MEGLIIKILKHIYINMLISIYMWLNPITMHLLSIKRAVWPKLHNMFKARDSKAWQREFPVTICALNLLLINIFLDIVTRIESRCVIKAKHVSLVC